MKQAGQSAGPTGCPIAIIGMGCIFPKARNLREYWRLIRTAADGITDVPPTHWKTADYFDPDPKRPDMTYCTRGGFLSAVPFDPIEFGIPPTSLEATDTAQLLGLVVGRMAMDDAGYGEVGGREFDRERVSVVLGVTGTLELALPLAARLGHPLWRRALAEAGVPAETAERVIERIAEGYVPWQENSFPGLLGNVVAGRIANRLNLRGTNCVVDAACASSLSAVHLAMLELSAGRSDMALTGGVDTLNDIFMFMCFSKTPALSPTGDARPFSEEADGTVIGEGVGMVVLKRLADAQRDGDRIYAVIRGMGSSSDGRSQSIYAPHAGGQARCLRNAYRGAGVDPATVELIEAHGTGTKVGDAVEVEALKTIFREAQADGTWCALGSVKSQIGHTKAAAGAAGLIKAALALHHGALPPTIKADRPNARMGLHESPFYLNPELRPWLAEGDHPRRAGVSSFGFGGSNFHAVLEEYTAGIAQPAWDGSVQLVAFAADDVGALRDQIAAFRVAISAPGAPDGLRGDMLAYHAAVSQRAFSPERRHRLVILLQPDTEAIERLDAVCARLDAANAGPEARSSTTRTAETAGEKSDARPDWNGLTDVYYGAGPAAGGVAVLFPGQGSQYVGMLRDWACTFPEMRSTLSEAEGSIRTPLRLSEAIFPRPIAGEGAEAGVDRRAASLTRTDMAQPALGAICLGMYRVLQRFGLTPSAFAGHSFGELTALCAAGRLDPATLWALSALRGRLMAECADEQGAMLAVGAPLAEVERLCQDERLDLVLANRNAPRQAILSGRRLEIARAAGAGAARGWACRPLNVGGAFHSPLMAAAREPFRQALGAVTVHPSSTPVYANTTGRPYPADAASARDLLGAQMVRPVQFVEQIEAMYADGARTFIEVGPKAALTGLVSSILEGRPHVALAPDAAAGRRDGIGELARLLARLAALGHAVDLSEWEETPREPRMPKMVVPLVGANYRSTGRAEVSPAPRVAVDAGSRMPDLHAGIVSEGVNMPGDEVASSNGIVVPAGEATVSGAFSPIRPSDAALRAPELLRSEAPRRVSSAEEDGVTGGARAAHIHSPVESPAPEAVSSPFGSDSGSLGDRSGASSASPTGVAVKAARAAPAAGELPDVQDVNEPSQLNAAPEGGRGAGMAAPRATPESTLQAAPTYGAAAETMQFAREGLLAMQALQQQTAAAHQRFLEQQESAHRTIQRLIEAQWPRQADVGRTPAAEAAPEAAMPARATEPMTAALHGPTVVDRAETVTATRAPSAAPRVEEPSAPHAAVQAVIEQPATRSPPARPSDLAQVESVLLAVVSEKTGYPLDMLGPDMDIEADLGIDSIKRVEIIAGVEERLPQAVRIQPEYMGGLRTLRQIVEFMSASARSAPAAPAPAGAGDPVRRAQGNSSVAAEVSPESPAPPEVSDGGASADALLAIVSELTGYPREMLGMEMDIEADLGIDSIKRVEILAAAESRIPGFKPVNPEYLGGLRTLGEILACGIGATGSASAAAAPCATPAKASTPASAGNAEGIGRRVVGLVKLPPATAGKIPVALGRTILVSDDGTGMADRMVALLRREGCAAQVFMLDGKGNEVEWASAGGLILLAPPGRACGAAGSEAGEQFLKRALAAARSAAPGLVDAARAGGSLFATVTRLDGGFGFSGRADCDAAAGALGGLAKTAAHEWPGVQCRALDCDGAWKDLDAAAEAIVRELAADGPLEVALGEDVRRGIALSASPSAPGRPQIAAGDVILITGGARGVTAEVAAAMARAWRPTLILIGRSPSPTPEPAWLATLSEAATIKQAILREEFEAAGRAATPVELETAYRRWMANREVAANLARIAAAGSRVEYVQADVRDGDAVRRLVTQVRDRHGPIRGLIHAAGVIEDRRIVDKTPAQADAVIGTKVGGLRHLLDALRDDDLKQIVLFSSVSARFGNAGQADYAMANEALNKAAHRLSRERPDCRVVSINWGPWAGGMVTPERARQFERCGVELIPPASGAAALVTELAGGTRDEVEVIFGAGFDAAGASSRAPAFRPDAAAPGTALGAGRLPPSASLPGEALLAPPEPSAGALRTDRPDVRGPVNSPLQVSFRRTIELQSHPVLGAHMLNRRPVLPLALMVEWLGHSALHGHPGLTFLGIDDLRLLRGLVLDVPRRILTGWAGRARRVGDEFQVPVELRSTVPDPEADLVDPASGGLGGEIVHARAIVTLGARHPAAPTPSVRPSAAAAEGARTASALYPALLFHGPALQSIEEIDACEESCVAGRLRAAPPPIEWMADPLRSAWLTDPLVLDGAFQLAIVWCREHLGAASLPTGFTGYRQYCPVFPREGVRALLSISSANRHGMRGDVTFTDSANRVVARLDGYECAVSPTLHEAFAAQTEA